MIDVGLAVFTCIVGAATAAIAVWSYRDTKASETFIRDAKQRIDASRARLSDQLVRMQERQEMSDD